MEAPTLPAGLARRLRARRAGSGRGQTGPSAWLTVAALVAQLSSRLMSGTGLAFGIQASFIALRIGLEYRAPG